MKTAVVYYTLSGNTALVAQEIKDQLNADSLRLRTIDEKKRGRIRSMFWGCIMVLSKKKPPLKPYTFDASAYDLIIIGVPVWAGKPAPPMQTFLSGAKLAGKKIALFVTHAGGKGSSLDILKTLLQENEIVSVADFKDAAKTGGENLKQQVADWVKNLK